MKIGHTAIVVSDMEKSKAFYSKILGGEIVGQSSTEKLEFTYLNVGGLIIELLKYIDVEVGERSRGPIDHIAFFVDDLKKEIVRLKKLEVKLLFDEPRKVNDMIIMFFLGPDGERIEFMEKI